MTVLPSVPSVSPTPLLGFQPTARANPFVSIVSGVVQGMEQRRQHERDQHTMALQLRDQKLKEEVFTKEFGLQERQYESLSQYRNDMLDLQEQGQDLRDRQFNLNYEQAQQGMAMSEIAMEQAQRQTVEERRLYGAQAELREATKDQINLASQAFPLDQDGIPQHEVQSFNGFGAAGGEIELTNYGYSNDSTPDTNSNVLKKGNRNNRLVPGVSVALNQRFAKKIGAKLGDVIKMTDGNGAVKYGVYDDTAPESSADRGAVVDLYRPESGSNSFSGSLSNVEVMGAKNIGKGFVGQGQASFQNYLSAAGLTRSRSAEDQLRHLRDVERRHPEMGPEERAMLAGERTRLMAENPGAVESDQAQRQLEQLRAAAVGSERRAYLDDYFEGDLQKLESGQPMDPVAFTEALQGIRAVDIQQSASSFSSPLAKQDEAFQGLVTSAGAMTDILEAYQDFARTGSVENNAVVGGVRNVLSKFGLDKPAELLKGIVEGNTPGFARALGHTGVLTEQDVQSVKSALPTSASTEEVALKLVEKMRGNIYRQALALLDRMETRGVDLRPMMRGMVRAGVPITPADAAAYEIQADEFRALQGVARGQALPATPSSPVADQGGPLIIQDSEGNRYRYKGSGPTDDVNNYERL